MSHELLNQALRAIVLDIKYSPPLLKLLPEMKQQRRTSWALPDPPDYRTATLGAAAAQPPLSLKPEVFPGNIVVLVITAFSRLF